MSKRPSEWSRREVWEESAKHHCRLWGLNPYENQIDAFPADPVERVSDDDLGVYADNANTFGRGMSGDREIRLMALELIERRKADKEQGR